MNKTFINVFALFFLVGIAIAQIDDQTPEFGHVSQGPVSGPIVQGRNIGPAHLGPQSNLDVQGRNFGHRTQGQDTGDGSPGHAGSQGGVSQVYFSQGYAGNAEGQDRVYARGSDKDTQGPTSYTTNDGNGGSSFFYRINHR